MNILEEISFLEAQIKVMKERIDHLRGVCKHEPEKRTFKYGSDMGNWSGGR